MIGGVLYVYVYFYMANGMWLTEKRQKDDYCPTIRPNMCVFYSWDYFIW